MPVSDEHLERVYYYQKPGGFINFCRDYYELLTGRPYRIPKPEGRRPHVYDLCWNLEDVFYLKTKNLNILMPSGHLKSTHLALFMPWAYTFYGDCNFIYGSYSLALAQGHVNTARAIMKLPEYYNLFLINVNKDHDRQGDFKTTERGRVYASGLSGTITGIDAGLPFMDRFSGAFIFDDGHNIVDVFSDHTLAKDHANFDAVVSQRPRGPNVPIINAMQTIREGDFGQRFLADKEPVPWTTVLLPGLDENDNALAPEIKSKEYLIKMRELQPYIFWAQIQQKPSPMGGALFKEEWFQLLDDEPQMLVTFITVDTAETEKAWNDATSFSFVGAYKQTVNGRETGEIGCHIINNWEIRIEPKDLEYEFLKFYDQCMLYPTPPKFVAIETKSTGVTLESQLRARPGILVRAIERNSKSGSKSYRFIQNQYHFAKKLISLPRFGRHTGPVITHMSKISPKGEQAHDDICDTICDATELIYGEGKIALSYVANASPQQQNLIATVNKQAQLTAQLRQRAWQRDR